MAKDPKPSDKKRSDTARRIWLAGIGAYGKAFEEGVGALRGLGGSVSGTTSEAFESLAEKGESIENAAKMKGMEIAGKSGVFEIDDRIKAMRERLAENVPNLSSLGGRGGLGSQAGKGSRDERLEAIEMKLDTIEAKLDALLKAAAPKRRAATQKSKPVAAKKSNAKKTTPKKPAE